MEYDNRLEEKIDEINEKKKLFDELTLKHKELLGKIVEFELNESFRCFE